jgi:hypothetical protein
MSVDIYSLIADAMKNHHQVRGSYQGHYREMCPHVLGYKDGEPRCFFYQFDGTSSSGKIEDGSKDNWRFIPIYELENVSVVDGPWHTHENFPRGTQNCVEDIMVVVCESPDSPQDVGFD